MPDVISGATGKIGSETRRSRFHPALVALHWISAILILVAIATGTILLKETSNSSPDKIVQLRAHMVLGVTILVLTIAQFAARALASKPARVTTGLVLFDQIAVVTHYGLYAAVTLMALSGIATAAMAGLPAIVFGNSGAPLPETFAVFLPRIAHGVLAKVIIGLVLLHLLGTLYHLAFRKDGLLRRMWFGLR